MRMRTCLRWLDVEALRKAWTSDHQQGNKMNLQDGMEMLTRWAYGDSATEADFHAAAETEPMSAQRLSTKLAAARSIRQLRARAGLSQEQMATLVGLAVSRMIAIEIGKADCLLTLQVTDSVRKLIGQA